MNYLWGGMILIGIIYGTVTGHLEEVSEAAIQSSKEAVSLCVVMAGVTALWVGMMRIAEKSGLLEAMEQRMQPVLNFLFPEIPGNHPSRKSIATNLLANILGLGWAATPAGLKAMEELADLEEERQKEKAAGSADRCSQQRDVRFPDPEYFLLQLIPVSIIAFRTEYGSVAPTAIVGRRFSQRRSAQELPYSILK